MADYYPAALAAAEAAIHDELKSSREVEPDRLAKVALDAAAPLLAEAWGVTERVRQIGRENRIGELYAEHAERMRELDDGAAENVSANSAAAGEDGKHGRDWLMAHVGRKRRGKPAGDVPAVRSGDG